MSIFQLDCVSAQTSPSDTLFENQIINFKERIITIQALFRSIIELPSGNYVEFESLHYKYKPVSTFWCYLYPYQTINNDYYNQSIICLRKSVGTLLAPIVASLDKDIYLQKIEEETNSLINCINHAKDSKSEISEKLGARSTYLVDDGYPWIRDFFTLLDEVKNELQPKTSSSTASSSDSEKRPTSIQGLQQKLFPKGFVPYSQALKVQVKRRENRTDSSSSTITSTPSESLKHLTKYRVKQLNKRPPTRRK